MLYCFLVIINAQKIVKKEVENKKLKMDYVSYLQSIFYLIEYFTSSKRVHENKVGKISKISIIHQKLNLYTQIDVIIYKHV